jgi:hypothetical protein
LAAAEELVLVIDVSELQLMLDALKRDKYTGPRRVQFADRLVEYKTIDEMRKAIADLESEIAARSGRTPSAFSLASHSRD